MVDYEIPKKGSGKHTDIEKIFNDSFPNDENSAENIKKFRESVSQVLKRNISSDQALDQLFGILKKRKDNDNLLDCVQSATKVVIETFFSTKPKFQMSLFFPNESNEAKLVDFLGRAKKTLEVCVFSITNDRLADALYKAHKRGVNVRIISDDECAKNQGSDVYELGQAGIPVRTDDNEKNHMHNKFAIIDRKVLINGSFNWTFQATKFNQENVTVLENETLCAEYATEFDKLWASFSKNEIPAGTIPARFAKLKV